jgi:transcriptional regulator with XRE-family HTH domain
MADEDRYAAIGMDSRAGESTAAAAEGELAQWVEHGDLALLARTERGDGTELSVEQLFGRAILRLRLYFGWSQRELGRRARLHQSTISRVERGKQPGLSLKRLFALCRALRVVDVDLVTRKPSVPPTELEIMLRGDRWARAVAAADRRILAARVAHSREASSPADSLRLAQHGTLTPGDR